MSTQAPEKLCHECYAERFPGGRPRMVTWARECTQCHKLTPSLGTLIRVERQEPNSEQPYS